MKHLWKSAFFLLLSTGCNEGALNLSKDTGAIEDLCNDPALEQTSLAFDLSFSEDPPGCDWGENGNIERENGTVTARAEQVQGIALPEGTIMCDVALDFNGVDPSSVQTIIYDDHFFLTFNDAVLASSHGDLVAYFPQEDDLPIYRWGSIVGVPVDWSSAQTYCLGEEDGLAECDIPPTEEQGPISLAYDEDIIHKLARRAIDENRFDYSFITIGDNDPSSDCTHEAFTFVVTAKTLAL